MERDHPDIATPGKMDQNDVQGSNPDLNKVNSEPNALHVSTSPDITETPTEKPAEKVASLAGEQENQIRENEENHSENAQNQLVLYDPAVSAAGEVEPLRARRNSFPNYTSRVLPSVGAFTVQCASCFKWRLIPTKEKYEEIREHILEQPFYCETAREWRPEVSCDDPPDITQDGSRLWAIDRPNIAQPPPGWERLLRIRAEGGTKFADVYYVSPSGKRLRSMVEVLKHLEEHPEYVAQGVQTSQFSFQIPRPLQEDYVKKRRPPPSRDGPSDVNPISWVAPDGNTGLLLGGAGPSAPSDTAPLDVLDGNAPKKPKLMGDSDSVI
ncbi:PREDICTED: methyl-CpG-binding domain-containing protein 2-like [Nicotiana attenuata]|uniref:Methyl-cpg-binding domain-containing protein 2 n=1 Tax=Nicotiana attenuata TaxID=49451 RepID=A0A314L314_NICAT|nr:PREDICTED: methyl-CpG-binding domain-containing protein 2-like [Nicotiana attenuata]XP_019265182.1 PREDICTED: methyl-CpG-binding domain-containing protein 2-like [Nicotiana attenuata]OIT35892.1 methyl-cpg-binding domain-containing protein 2 [Nicotiana attenuata]